MRISTKRLSPSGRVIDRSCSPGSLGRPKGRPIRSSPSRPSSSRAAPLAKRTSPALSRMTMASGVSCTSVTRGCLSGSAVAGAGRSSRARRRWMARRSARPSACGAPVSADRQSSAPDAMASACNAASSTPTASTGALGPRATVRRRKSSASGSPAPISTISASMPGASKGSMPSSGWEKLKLSGPAAPEAASPRRALQSGVERLTTCAEIGGSGRLPLAPREPICRFMAIPERATFNSLSAPPRDPGYARHRSVRIAPDLCVSRIGSFGKQMVKEHRILWFHSGAGTNGRR